MSEIAGEQRGQRSHAQRNHELLVEAARQVFAEQGLDASLGAIARRAGVGIGTLYRHFSTREALVEALFERRIGELLAVAERAAAEPDGWRALVSLLEQTLELQAGDRVLKALMLRYPPGEGRLASARQELRGLFEETLEHARAQGRLRADFTRSDLALLFWSFAPLIDATAEVAPGAWKRHLHWLLDGLRADGATPQTEPPLSDEEVHVAMSALREQHSHARRPPPGGQGAPRP